MEERGCCLIHSDLLPHDLSRSITTTKDNHFEGDNDAPPQYLIQIIILFKDFIVISLSQEKRFGKKKGVSVIDD